MASMMCRCAAHCHACYFWCDMFTSNMYDFTPLLFYFFYQKKDDMVQMQVTRCVWREIYQTDALGHTLGYMQRCVEMLWVCTEVIPQDCTSKADVHLRPEQCTFTGWCWDQLPPVWMWLRPMWQEVLCCHMAAGSNDHLKLFSGTSQKLKVLCHCLSSQSGRREINFPL